ncbi:hypothetical protein AAHD62_16470 [Enterobacter hormaechei]
MGASINESIDGLSVFFLTPTSGPRSTREQAPAFSPFLRFAMPVIASARTLSYPMKQIDNNIYRNGYCGSIEAKRNKAVKEMICRIQINIGKRVDKTGGK